MISIINLMNPEVSGLMTVFSYTSGRFVLKPAEN